MTMPNTAFQAPQAGDGATLNFNFTWRVVEDSSVAVYVNKVKKTLGVDYTLVTNRLTTGLGGTVTFTVAPANGAAIVIQRESDQIQTTVNLEDNEAMPPSSVMFVFDKLFTLVQDALRKYQSADTAIAAGTLSTFAHGLGKVPDRVQILLVCQVIDAGYAVGDVIDLHSVANIATVQRDMTNVYLRTLSVLGNVAVPNKATFVSTNLTLANWKLRVLAS